MKVVGLLLTVCLLLTPILVSANTNVALNAPVTTSGSFLSGPQTYVCDGTPAAPSSVDNGVFYTEGTCWNDGVAWTGFTNTIDISFGGTYTIDSAIVQADDNDTYLLQYLGTDNLYHNWWQVPYDYSFGLVTRPNADQVTPQGLSTVVATGVRILATDGDGYNSVGQIEVFTAPEPASLLLLAAALPALGAFRRLRK